MDFNTYQNALDQFAKYPEKGQKSAAALAYCALGLTGESGEYAEKIKKFLRDGTLSPELAKKELGDVLWYTARSAWELGFTLEDVALTNLEKLLDRQERGVLKGSGDER
jgi:NTP pyrophosphatase (non-canonical NTP hydrolase)